MELGHRSVESAQHTGDSLNLVTACERCRILPTPAFLHLLFWLSLVPFVTAWMGQGGPATAPVAAYGAVLFMCALSYALLEHRLVRMSGTNPALAHAIGRDRKVRFSLLAYGCGIVLGLVQPWLGLAIYVAVAIVWFVPDSRIEKEVLPNNPARCKSPSENR